MDYDLPVVSIAAQGRNSGEAGTAGKHIGRGLHLKVRGPKKEN